MGSVLGYPDYLRINQFAWNLNRLLKNVMMDIKGLNRSNYFLKFAKTP
jgi:hypothetical protein